VSWVRNPAGSIKDSDTPQLHSLKQHDPHNAHNPRQPNPGQPPGVVSSSGGLAARGSTLRCALLPLSPSPKARRAGSYGQAVAAEVARIITVIWSPASEQVADQQVCVSYMWLTSSARAGSVLARGRHQPT
jgi:hypothetical protein